MNSVCNIAPPPPIRRRRPVPAEPTLFALLLTLLTLGINISVPQAQGEREATQALPQQLATLR